ncbi:MAG: DUF2752 domain-containing protein, partial [Mycobacterium sp.]
MELGLPATLRGGFFRRSAPICCGAALTTGAAFLATNDPGATGARYPGCVFHQMTGLWCPGCGLTRGTYELLHGHVGAALGYNIFTPLALAAIVVAWFAWLRVSWGAAAIRLPQSSLRWMAGIIPTIVVAYSLLRNIPLDPLRSLA